MADRQSKEQAAENARIRRRWLTLAEILAVLGLIISGLTLWNNYQARTSADEARIKAEQAQEEAAKGANQRAASLLLRAEAAKGGETLQLSPFADGQAIQSQTIRFPSAFKLDPITTVSDPRIVADWFERPLKRALDDAGIDEDARGDARVPVLIETRFIVDGESHVDRALYDVGYGWEGHFLGGKDVVLRGLSLIERTSAAKGSTRLDALWKARAPVKKKG